jgi:hypothetical protein
MLLVTEPEAAAVYTARYLKELYGADFLRVGLCHREFDGHVMLILMLGRRVLCAV